MQRSPIAIAEALGYSLSAQICGRYTDTKRDKQMLVRMAVAQAEIDFVPRHNIAPTPEAAISWRWLLLCQESLARRTAAHTWNWMFQATSWMRYPALSQRFVDGRPQTKSE